MLKYKIPFHSKCSSFGPVSIIGLSGKAHSRLRKLILKITSKPLVFNDALNNKNTEYYKDSNMRLVNSVDGDLGA